MTKNGLCANSLRVAGVMTGTSCDGLDLACVEFDGPVNDISWRTLGSGSAAYPPELRRRVLRAQAPGYAATTKQWLELHRDLGAWYSATLVRMLKKLSPRPHLIANHGQTIAHFPAGGLTLQLGDPSLIAHSTGISVACSFREGDLAASGQGAPLVPRFHAMLAQKLGAPNCRLSIHNLGGVSNLTYFGASPKILAFDTGPGNFWIDTAASLATRGKLNMDLDGKLARRGKVDIHAVRSILSHPFFAKKAPKSTGRDDFPFELLLSQTRAKGADLVATATEITIASISLSYHNAILRRGLPLDVIYFGGGGAKNPAILEGIQLRLPKVKIRSLQEAGVDPQLVEAQAFAYYGCLTLLGTPLGGPWTGTSGFAPPGHLIPGANWALMLSRIRETRSRPAPTPKR